MTTQLATIVEQNNLVPETARSLIEAFTPVFAAADEAVKASAGITVTDATQVREMKAARTARLKLREIRIQTENARKTMKEDSLRRGKAIDGIANIVKFMIEPEETRLEECEKFAERAEAARLNALADARRAMIAPYVNDPAEYPVTSMSEEAFAATLDGLKAARQRKLDEEARVAREREEAARLDREERARIAEENARLKAERDAAERERAAEAARVAAERAAADAERRAAEAKAAAELKAERDRVAALEAKAKAEREAEAARVAEEERARTAAANAPDLAKLKAFADAVRGVAVPDCTTEAGKAVAADVRAKRESFAAWIEAQAARLN